MSGTELQGSPEFALGRRRKFASVDELTEEYPKSRATERWVPGAHALMARSVLRRSPDGNGYELVCAPAKEAAIYAEAGRHELAAQENAEVAVISEFLPKQMDEAQVTAAAKAAIAASGAAGVKDMGKVIAALKEAHPGQMDFAKASAIVKNLLSH